MAGSGACATSHALPPSSGMHWGLPHRLEIRVMLTGLRHALFLAGPGVPDAAHSAHAAGQEPGPGLRVHGRRDRSMVPETGLQALHHWLVVSLRRPMDTLLFSSSGHLCVPVLCLQVQCAELSDKDCTCNLQLSSPSYRCLAIMPILKRQHTRQEAMRCSGMQGSHSRRQHHPRRGCSAHPGAGAS